MRTFATVTGTGGALGVLAAAGRPALVAAAAVFVVLTAALCWIIRDSGRTTRLVRIIRAFRDR
jgi:Flp pilus assembly protein TadB